ncbi:MAG: divalent-cation tolerance protein CutA [Thermoproteota archaeon]|nr:divalent-cation tolerance protein CutA [Thermoproteota archaeon]
MVSTGVIIVSTFPSEELAAQIAHMVVSKKLCACVNFTKIRSIYSWHGKVEDQHEFIVLFKTTSKSAKKLKAEIVRLHPYDVPEIVELKMSDVSKPYLSWLVEESVYPIAKNRHNTSKRRNSKANIS